MLGSMQRVVVTVALVLAAANLLVMGSGASIAMGSGLVMLCANIYLCFLLLLGCTEVQHAVRTWCAQGVVGVLVGVLALWSPYGLYAGATGSLAGLPSRTLFLYVLLPPLVCLVTRRLPNPRYWQELVVALLLWLPLEFGWLTGVWPEQPLASALTVLVGICVGVFSVVCVRGLDQVGYKWRLQAMDWRVGGRLFLIFAPTAILLGLASGFLEAAETFMAPGPLAFMALGIFLVIALPEELLFRGIIQNILEKALGHRQWALGVTAVVFGLAHLNNGQRPDWRYVGLATLAGWFYGHAYLKTRNLMAPAVLHTLVDTVWRGFFR